MDVGTAVVVALVLFCLAVVITLVLGVVIGDRHQHTPPLQARQAPARLLRLVKRNIDQTEKE